MPIITYDELNQPDPVVDHMVQDMIESEDRRILQEVLNKLRKYFNRRKKQKRQRTGRRR